MYVCTEALAPDTLHFVLRMHHSKHPRDTLLSLPTSAVQVQKGLGAERSSDRFISFCQFVHKSMEDEEVNPRVAVLTIWVLFFVVFIVLPSLFFGCSGGGSCCVDMMPCLDHIPVENMSEFPINHTGAGNSSGSSSRRREIERLRKNVIQRFLLRFSVLLERGHMICVMGGNEKEEGDIAESRGLRDVSSPDDYIDIRASPDDYIDDVETGHVWEEEKDNEEGKINSSEYITQALTIDTALLHSSFLIFTRMGERF